MPAPRCLTIQPLQRQAAATQGRDCASRVFQPVRGGNVSRFGEVPLHYPPSRSDFSLKWRMSWPQMKTPRLYPRGIVSNSCTKGRVLKLTSSAASFHDKGRASRRSKASMVYFVQAVCVLQGV